MSSSEQAPEPTMDEILSSIRKIISDDEPGDSPQPKVAAEAATAPPAQDELANDLANALNDTQAGAEAPAAEDILDLTAVVSEQPQSEAPQGDALQNALGDVVQQSPEVSEPQPLEPTIIPEETPDATDATGQSAGDADISAVLAEAGIEVAAYDAPAEPQPAADPAPEMPEQASLDTSDTPSAAEVATPEAAPEAVAKPSADAEMGTGDMLAEAAAEPDAASTEMRDEETAIFVEPVQEAAPVEETAPAVAAAPAEVDAPTPAASEGQTLEDSVKDMLRPMLREWLDENMERIVQQEVASGNLKDGGG